MMLVLQNTPQDHILQQQQEYQQVRPQLHFADDFDTNDEDFNSLSLSSSPISTFSPIGAPLFPTSPLPAFQPVPAKTAGGRQAETASQDPVLVGDFDGDFDFNFGADGDIFMAGTNDMSSEPWLIQHHQQLGAIGRPMNRASHQRESSFSSLGSTSAGPASPFSQNTTNPHIAVTDPVSADEYATVPSYYDDQSYQLAKPMAASLHPNTTAVSTVFSNGNSAFAPPDGLSLTPNNYGSLMAASQRQRNSGPGNHKSNGSNSSNGSSGDQGLLPRSDLSIGNNRSLPVSVASSIASNSPATPLLDQLDEEVKLQNGEDSLSGTLGGEGSGNGNTNGRAGGDSPLSDGDDFFYLFDDRDNECSLFFNDAVAAFQATPKFDRALADVYSNELYSRNFTLPRSSMPPSAIGHPASSPSDEMYAQRLQTINNQHLTSASHQAPMPIGGGQRERSPFRHGSPFAPVGSRNFASSPASNMRFGSIQSNQQQQRQQQQQQRQQQNSGSDMQTFQAQLTRTQGNATPQTISPKDVVLEYHDSATTGNDASNFPLFPQTGAPGFSVSHMNKTGSVTNRPYQDLASSSNVTAQPSFNFMAASKVASTLPVLQQYPFIPQQHISSAGSRAQGSASQGSAVQRSAGQPMTKTLTQTSLPELTNQANSPRRTTDGGTYTCTYHNCSLRFETPALLQKHKREGHRQANTLGGGRRSDGSTSPNPLNTQAGPHHCERINPSTGKPCNTVFSRPYDLTRHEDTIHNARKQKVRCSLCMEEKTFSRADALTRHFRVCHPDVEFSGKHRKRVLHGN